MEPFLAEWVHQVLVLGAMTSGAAATGDLPPWVVRSAFAAVGTAVTVAAGAVWYAVTSLLTSLIPAV